MNEFDRTLLKLAILNEFKKSEVKVQSLSPIESWAEAICERYRVRDLETQFNDLENRIWTEEICEALAQSLGMWNKRYLVCWEAFYAHSVTKMDALVHYNFANKDLSAFKKEILFPITKERAGGKDKFEAGITITSICEV